MNAQIEPVPPEQQEKPAASPESAEKAARKEKAAAQERERFVRDAETEIESVFSLHGQLRQSTQAVLQAVEAAIGHGMALERKCSTSRFGRRLYLARRLNLKALMTVLGVARTQLKRSIGRMDADSRLRDPLLAEATDPELDH